MREALLLLAIGLSGCESETKYGKCIGLDGDESPGLHYHPSTRNIIIGVLFFELIVPPIAVVVEEFQCPDGRK